jgi:hypothetical protein
MPSVNDIAAEYVERAAALDPCYATYAGGTRAGPPATLVTLTQEIASLLGVQMRS